MILLDDRAGSKDLALYMPRGKFTLCRLEFSDAAFSGRGPLGVCTVGIEIKKIPDLVDCIYSGRYAGHQLPGMLDNFDYCYLLAEGATRAGKLGTLEYMRRGRWVEPYGGQMKRTISQYDYRAWLNSIRVQAGVHVIESFGTKDSARYVETLYRWWQKPWNKHHSLHVFMEPMERAAVVKPSIKQQIAAQLPGIGWEKSARVARHFETVVDMLIADERDWMAIDGIGKILASRIVRELRGLGAK